MRALDTNVLVHAHRKEMTKHAEARRLLHNLSEGTMPWGLPVFCLGEFLRVVTHHRVFTPPTTMQNALVALDGLLQSPSVRLLLPGDRYWSCLHNVISQGQATGNVVFDAQIVAVCLEHGVDFLISEDRGLKRFETIQVVSI
ncbi:MAG: PIN domain-containing protein [Nitrospira sp.]|nr:PIN domain-containing protein [Nitrospira sp.]MCY3955778.1 PIN domain-containing protein [Nitrospira sp.]MCY4133206.1 PIN domain-containing protein [Nitrospira sp.]